MKESREYLIERLPSWGRLEELKKNLEPKHTQEEIDIALTSALAYSQIAVAKYLLSLGADISYNNYNGVYYSVHNNEIEGLKFAIKQGVDVNINQGELLNTAVISAYNTKESTILIYLLESGADPQFLTKETLEFFVTGQIEEILKAFKN